MPHTLNKPKCATLRRCVWASSLEASVRKGGDLTALGVVIGVGADLALDPASGEPLGNTPQAFTHVGLISAALAIEERRRAQVSA